MPLQRSVSQHGHARFSRLVFIGQKRAALQRCNFQHIKETGGNKKRAQRADLRRLLVPQGFHRIHLHGAPCGKVAGQHGDSAEHGCDRDKGQRIGGANSV